MIPLRHPQSNVALTAPENWDEATRGRCGNLGAFFDASQLAWFVRFEPTNADLDDLLAGASIELKVNSPGFPPVALYAVPSAEPLPSAETPLGKARAEGFGDGRTVGEQACDAARLEGLIEGKSYVLQASARAFSAGVLATVLGYGVVNWLWATFG